MSGFLLRSDLYQPLTGTFNKCSANGPPRPAPASVDHAAARQEGRPWAAHTTAYGTRAGNYWSPVPFTFSISRSYSRSYCGIILSVVKFEIAISHFTTDRIIPQ